MKRCYLAIPPSAAKGTQMTKDVSETNRVANVRIFVEKATARLKWFRILKNEIPLLEIPLLNNIVIVCSALCNLLPPLCLYVNKNLRFNLITLRKPVFRNYLLVNNINNTLNVLFILFPNK